MIKKLTQDLLIGEYTLFSGTYRSYQNKTYTRP